MDDRSCTEFLQWCLPRLLYRWKGFRKVCRQVCRRLNHRLTELDLPDLQSYRGYLETNHTEWEILDSLCYITISRFYRDRKVFDFLQSRGFPSLVQLHTGNAIRCWSIGCCSGEEPYSLQILWQLSILPQMCVKSPFYIIATEKNLDLLERARSAIYPESSLKDLPGDFIPQAFHEHASKYTLRDRFRKNIEFLQQDIRTGIPDGDFHLILCRNLAFTYFQEDLQNEILERIISKLTPSGFLIIGSHESLPKVDAPLVQISPCIYQKPEHSHD